MAKTRGHFSKELEDDGRLAVHSQGLKVVKKNDGGQDWYYIEGIF